MSVLDSQPDSKLFVSNPESQSLGVKDNLANQASGAHPFNGGELLLGNPLETLAVFGALHGSSVANEIDTVIQFGEKSRQSLDKAVGEYIAKQRMNDSVQEHIRLNNSDILPREIKDTMLDPKALMKLSEENFHFLASDSSGKVNAARLDAVLADPHASHNTRLLATVLKGMSLEIEMADLHHVGKIVAKPTISLDEVKSYADYMEKYPVIGNKIALWLNEKARDAKGWKDFDYFGQDPTDNRNAFMTDFYGNPDPLLDFYVISGVIVAVASVGMLIWAREKKKQAAKIEEHNKLVEKNIKKLQLENAELERENNAYDRMLLQQPEKK